MRSPKKINDENEVIQVYNVLNVKQKNMILSFIKESAGQQNKLDGKWWWLLRELSQVWFVSSKRSIFKNCKARL